METQFIQPREARLRLSELRGRHPGQLRYMTPSSTSGRSDSDSRQPAHRPTRVVVGEDHYLVREGIRRALSSDRSIKLAGMAADGNSLRELIERETPDVVLTDVRMPPSGRDEGIEIAAWLREDSPDTGVILISQYQQATYALRLLERGSQGRGYLLKDRIVDETELLGAVHEIAAGGSVIDSAVVDALVSAMESAEASPLAHLSMRERQVLAAVAEGKSNAVIAGVLRLSKGSVEKHINSIFQKLDLPSEKEVSRRVMATLLFLVRG